MLKEFLIPALIFAGIGAASGILLTLFSKFLAVKTDERADMLNEALPGANCGACGYSGCAAYAEAILKGAPTNACVMGGDAVAKKVSEIMGTEQEATERKVAFVRCLGTSLKSGDRFDFYGIPSCKSSNRFYSGSKKCPFGCLGYGDCAMVCPQGAITIKDNLASVDISKCVGCGLCAKECPNNLIIVKKISDYVDVACSSTFSGKDTRAACKGGCIGCRLCEKNCPVGAITVKDNLAVIDHEKCTSCGKCVSVCPAKIITDCRAPKTEEEKNPENAENKQ